MWPGLYSIKKLMAKKRYSANPFWVTYNVHLIAWYTEEKDTSSTGNLLLVV